MTRSNLYSKTEFTRAVLKVSANIKLPPVRVEPTSLTISTGLEVKCLADCSK